jgi:hypothetical protein
VSDEAEHTKALHVAGEAVRAFYKTTLADVPRNSTEGNEIHELVSIVRDHLSRAAGFVDAAKKAKGGR